MISHGKDIKIFCGNANQPLAEEICRMMGTKLGEAEVKSFADGEVSVSLYETVRGSDVFVVQSTCKPVNDNLMELLVMIDALRRASAGRITAVIPYFGYARQDRKAKARDPISAKLVANMITAAGADRVLTMDLHASQIQGFFDIPVDNLLGNPIFVDYYAKKFGNKCEDMIVVSPDVGSVARARAFAQKLHMQMAIVEFARDVLGYQDANSIELNPETTHPVIALMPEQNGVVNLGGTLRLGAYPCVLKEGSKARELYGKEELSERHRHRYEVNNEYRQALEEKGMVLSGLSPDKRIVEMLELPDHPFFVGTQGHPELKSRPNRAHPLFRGLIQAAVAYHQ